MGVFFFTTAPPPPPGKKHTMRFCCRSRRTAHPKKHAHISAIFDKTEGKSRTFMRFRSLYLQVAIQIAWMLHMCRTKLAFLLVSQNIPKKGLVDSC